MLRPDSPAAAIPNVGQLTTRHVGNRPLMVAPTATLVT